MKYSDQEKQEFIQQFKNRSKQFAIDIVNLCDELPNQPSTKVIRYQLIKSATSTGANYRAACRGRSQAEFFAKMSIVTEEADESLFWLELLKECNINCDEARLNILMKEADELVRVFSKARKNTYK